MLLKALAVGIRRSGARCVCWVKEEGEEEEEEETKEMETEMEMEERCECRLHGKRSATGSAFFIFWPSETQTL